MKQLDANYFLERYRLAELQSELNQAGFQTEVDVQIGELIVDLVARVDGRSVAYKVKSPTSLRASAEEIESLRQAVREAGFEFRLFVATPPRETSVEVEGINMALLSYLVDHVPSELEAMAGNTVLDEVADVEIEAIRIEIGSIGITGTAAIGVTLQSLGSGDDSFGLSDSFYCDFDVVLDDSLQVVEGNFQVDTSPFYGDEDDV